MHFLQSVLFGSEGNYNILGVEVKFKKTLYSYNLGGVGFLSKLATECINNTAFQWLTLGYMHVLVHEFSHGIAYKLFTDRIGIITIFTNNCSGQISNSYKKLDDWQSSIVAVAGPVGDIAFSIFQLIAATRLKSYLSTPFALLLGGGAVFWISGELLYAFVSAKNKDSGDFGNIAKYSELYLMLASVTIISEVALGVFLAINLST